MSVSALSGSCSSNRWRLLGSTFCVFGGQASASLAPAAWFFFGASSAAPARLLQDLRLLHPGWWRLASWELFWNRVQEPPGCLARPLLFLLLLLLRRWMIFDPHFPQQEAPVGPFALTMMVLGHEALSTVAVEEDRRRAGGVLSLSGCEGSAMAGYRFRQRNRPRARVQRFLPRWFQPGVAMSPVASAVERRSPPAGRVMSASPSVRARSTSPIAAVLAFLRRESPSHLVRPAETPIPRARLAVRLPWLVPNSHQSQAARVPVQVLCLALGALAVRLEPWA